MNVRRQHTGDSGITGTRGLFERWLKATEPKQTKWKILQILASVLQNPKQGLRLDARDNLATH